MEALETEPATLQQWVRHWWGCTTKKEVLQVQFLGRSFDLTKLILGVVALDTVKVWFSGEPRIGLVVGPLVAMALRMVPVDSLWRDAFLAVFMSMVSVNGGMRIAEPVEVLQACRYGSLGPGILIFTLFMGVNAAFAVLPAVTYLLTPLVKQGLANQGFPSFTLLMVVLQTAYVLAMILGVVAVWQFRSARAAVTVLEADKIVQRSKEAKGITAQDLPRFKATSNLSFVSATSSIPSATHSNPSATSASNSTFKIEECPHHGGEEDTCLKCRLWRQTQRGMPTKIRKQASLWICPNCLTVPGWFGEEVSVSDELSQPSRESYDDEVLEAESADVIRERMDAMQTEDDKMDVLFDWLPILFTQAQLGIEAGNSQFDRQQALQLLNQNFQFGRIWDGLVDLLLLGQRLTFMGRMQLEIWPNVVGFLLNNISLPRGYPGNFVWGLTLPPMVNVPAPRPSELLFGELARFLKEQRNLALARQSARRRLAWKL